VVDISQNVVQAAQGFVRLQDVTLFSGKASPTTMKLFMPRLNGREFDYIAMKDSLLEALTDYSLSRRTIQRYIDRQNYRHMTDEARAKFRTYLIQDISSEQGRAWRIHPVCSSGGAPARPQNTFEDGAEDRQQ
jgi:hypothetical protein